MVKRGPRKPMSRKRLLLVYAVLLLLSHLFTDVLGVSVWPRTRPIAGAETRIVRVPMMNDDGALAGRDVGIAVTTWQPATPDPSMAPVVLLHGSPSSGAADFTGLGARLARDGRTVHALCRPGWGGSDKWPASYSVLANARTVQAVLDAMGVPRAHVIGWSYSGAVAAHMADTRPEQMASMTLLSAMVTQEGEGSGDYTFERLKYLAGWGLVVALPEAIPHFGLLGDRWFRVSFIRDFLDTDLRPLRDVLRRIQTPTLILHGRNDPLVPAWAAELHHELLKPSKLVILDASHFFPMGDGMERDGAFEEGAQTLARFMERHDDPQAAPLNQSAIFSPPRAESQDKLMGIDLSRGTKWWIVVLLIILATFVSEDLTVVTVGLLVGAQRLDLGVGLVGCFMGIVIGDLGLWALGRIAGRRILRWPLIRGKVSEKGLAHWSRVFDQHPGKAVLISRCLPGTRAPTFIAAGILATRARRFILWFLFAALVWTPFLLVISMIVGPKLLGLFREVFHGPWAIVASILAAVVIIRVVSAEATAIGRYKLRADLKRLVSPEFWPAWFFYLPLVPYFLYLSARHGGPMTFTCANPGIPVGGGIVGESKSLIFSRVHGEARRHLVHSALIPAGETPEQRTQRVRTLLSDDPGFGGYPAVLKPDSGQRGFAFKVVRTDQDVFEYFEQMTRPAQLQAYVPGPCEAGVLWARVPRGGARVEDWEGEIFAVTRKTFPVITGDGTHTLEELIWMHPRFRLQAKTFIARHEDQLDRVLEAGESLRLAIAGNHCQGTLFTDGRELASPELCARLSEVLRSFETGTGRTARDRAELETGSPNLGGFDFGRMDIRYTSDEELKRGEGFKIVELNGTMSESTNMYDPARPITWTYGVLFRHWKRLFEIGAARRREGQRPVGLLELRRTMREFYHARPGSAVAD